MREGKKNKKEKSFSHNILRGLKHIVLHNGWLKAIAVVISVVLGIIISVVDSAALQIFKLLIG